MRGLIQQDNFAATTDLASIRGHDGGTKEDYDWKWRGLSPENKRQVEQREVTWRDMARQGPSFDKPSDCNSARDYAAGGNSGREKLQPEGHEADEIVRTKGGEKRDERRQDEAEDGHPRHRVGKQVVTAEHGTPVDLVGGDGGVRFTIFAEHASGELVLNKGDVLLPGVGEEGLGRGEWR